MRGKESGILKGGKIYIYKEDVKYWWAYKIQIKIISF
jgi:hypothetical protein